MRIISALGDIARDMAAQKLRTVLTIFGIVWGTVSIIVLLSFGSGFQEQTMRSMNGIGESVILMFPGRTAKVFEGYGRNRRIQFTEEDADLLNREIRGIQYISPEYSTWDAPVRYGTRLRNPNVTGIIPEYGLMRQVISAEGGRFINERDMKERRRVIFLGDKLAAYLFGSENPVGSYVAVAGAPFRVIGVMREKEQDSSYNSRDEDRAFIPAATFRAVFGHRYVNNLVIKPKDPRFSADIQDQVYKVLGKKYTFDPNDKEALSIWDTTEFQKMILYIFIGFNAFMAVIGLATLTVGGIGVANIMYVVVQERTKEIGIKRAVGARRRHIMGQFIFETLCIVFVGAAVGYGISAGLVGLIGLLPIDEFVGTPRIAWWVAVTAFSILAVIGLFAGYFPAKKAAGLQVVDCLQQ